jgi:hypothetical protein
MSSVVAQSFQCSRPYYGVLADGRIFDWGACVYAADGLGLAGVGLFVLAGGFIGLLNWSEGWAVPITWTAIVGPPMAAGVLLPGGLLRLVAGALTLAMAGLFIGAYWWWGRA